MIRVAYNSQKRPPAPFVLAEVISPLDGSKVTNVPAQIDTAADRALVPLNLLESLNLAAIDQIVIGGVGGNQEAMPLFVVEIGFFSMPPQLVCVVAHPEEPWILLGRDLLNLFRLVLDGPEGTLEIH